jgi:hypothetical protein
MKICSVVFELLHGDRWTDMAQLIGAVEQFYCPTRTQAFSKKKVWPFIKL